MSQDTLEFSPVLLKKLRSSQTITILTGAGMSAESGIPTFRGSQDSLWEKYRPQDLATPQAFRENPKIVWDWYAWRRQKVEQAKPNAGHYALAQLEQRIPNLTIITQNVDSLHQLAGSKQVIELHGNIRRVKCFDQHHPAETWQEPENSQEPPRCSICGSYLRPDVVWFGEKLPEANLLAAYDASVAAELFFVIGTASMVEPAASLARIALEHGADVAFVNPDPDAMSGPPEFRLQGGVTSVLPALIQAAWPD
jgi:NAD-dependent deacetylase